MRGHLVVDLSGQGCGHAAISVPILNALRCSWPDLKLTIRTAVPRASLAERLAGSFDYVSQPDFGMVVSDALHVVPNQSAFAYWCQYGDWGEMASKAANKLASLKPRYCFATFRSCRLPQLIGKEFLQSSWVGLIGPMFFVITSRFLMLTEEKLKSGRQQSRRMSASTGIT